MTIFLLCRLCGRYSEICLRLRRAGLLRGESLSFGYSAALSAQEGILLPKFLAGLEQSLRRRSCFADPSDVSMKLSDLFVVARADGCIGPAWVADIDAEMFHRGFHHRRQSIGGPFPGKQSVTARPETRCFEIPGAKGPDDLRADAGAGRGHGCARAAEHERH